MSNSSTNHRFTHQSRNIIAITIAAIVFACGTLLTTATADEKAEALHDFVGAKKCKMCHKSKQAGSQYSIWLDSKHSKAFETLASEDGLKAAKEAGVEDPQKSGKCLKCHSTAYNFTETMATNIAVKKSTGKARLTVEESVGCESCHFAGGDYKKKKIMKDHDLAVSKGLNPEPKKMCLNCHNDESPFWDTTRYKLADGKTAGFDFDQAWDKIKHLRPKATDTK